MNEARQAWEDRATNLGARPSGVLFKGLTDSANAALHDWHVEVIRSQILSRVKDGGLLLDLGCGYGRISAQIRTERPSIASVGQDLSQSYCASFQANGQSAVVADLAACPFKEAVFDACIAITSMMYLPDSRQPMAFREVARILRPGSYFLVVDPGEELRRFLRRVGIGRDNKTGGRGFFCEEYKQIATSSGFEVIDVGGNPQLTLRTLLTLGGRLGWQLLPFLRSSSTGGYSIFALHRWMLLRLTDSVGQ